MLIIFRVQEVTFGSIIAQPSGNVIIMEGQIVRRYIEAELHKCQCKEPAIL